MPPIDFLGKTKARLLTCGALMAGGTLVSGAIAASNPITGTALGTLAMAGSVAGGIFANDLGDLAKGLGENEEILNDRELTQAVGLAIALVLFELLTDFDFIEAKLSHPDIKIQELIEDYDRAFEAKVLIYSRFQVNRVHL